MISLDRQEIEALIDVHHAALAIEEAFRATSRGQVNLPPIGHITFPGRGADCHIKYGHLQDAPTFVIKVATGFPHNADLGLATGNGLVLVLSAETGQVQAVLHDEMVLTDIRTGLGGAIATRLLARKDSKQILVVGTGPQARRQIEAHAALLSEPVRFRIWGRNAERAADLIEGLSSSCVISVADNLEQEVRQADIVVTATGAAAPLIMADWVMPGTHITAVGADAPGKQELEVDLVGRADVLSVDLATQCIDHGEVSHAVKAGRIDQQDLKELGSLLMNTDTGRTNESQITIADLTGIAAQDIAMANSVLSAFKSRND
ncbi:MAG: ornithine cyclodeaminase family protein [Stappiaceae bacterium]